MLAVIAVVKSIANAVVGIFEELVQAETWLLDTGDGRKTV
jgi:hypothetical protein